MSKKQIVFIDGSSMIKGAFYGLPSGGAYGIRNVISQILGLGEAHYLAVALNYKKESFQIENKMVQDALLKEEKSLEDMLTTMEIPVLKMEDFCSADILASVAKQCQEDADVEITIITEDKKLLQLVSERVSVKLPVVEEEGMTLKLYAKETILEEYDGIEPQRVKGALSLTGNWEIGIKTACLLMKEYETIENLYLHTDAVESTRVREALLAHEDEVRLNEKQLTLREDCDICLDYKKAAVENILLKNIDIGKEISSQEEVQENEESVIVENFITITDFSEAEAIFAKCVEGCRIGMQLVIEKKEIIALSICLEEACYCFLPQGFLTPDYLVGKAEEICKRAGQVIVLDLKKQLAYLKLEQESPVIDASVAAYLLNPLSNTYEYQDLAKEYLNVTTPSKTELFGKSSLKKALEEDKEKAISCICTMAYVAGKCGDKLIEELKSAGMEKLFYEVEMPLIYSLYRMETAGVRVERNRLKEYGDRLKVQIKELEETIHKETGEDFNINSPKQLGEVLFERMKLPGGKKTKTGYSTAADILEKLAPDYPVIGKILDYRQLTKLNSTYAEGLAACIEDDDRIHGTFNQTITATGRISSTEPNLQNIPIRMELGREIRKVFVPEEGCVFVDADYSQIELRILAHMSGDERLIGAYKHAEDIHAMTASQVFHVPFEEVTPLQRRNAKAVNFGIVYGISSFGLSEGLSITRKEASEYIEKYFETYPGVKTFLDDLVTKAKEQGYAISMFDRRRPVPELKSSNFMRRSFGERVAMNSPIQGTAADIMKIAMIGVDKALKERGLKSRIVLQIHDELLIETHREELEQVKELLEEEMKHAADLEVSLEVEAKVGDSWFDAK